MAQSRLLFAFLGIVIGVLGTLLLSGHSGTPVQAQPAAKPAEVGRYQISAWGTGQMSPAGKLSVANGAYIIDTQTGEVFSVANEGKPKSIGVIEKK